MKLLAQINIPRSQETAMIQLLQGDLSVLPEPHETDILVMAAFPGDYTALPGSLIYALNEKGLSVETLANDKETDLRPQLHCWLSKPLSIAAQQKFNFKRILCFEPGEKINEPAQVVSNIFRCINTFAFNDENNVVAMPIIGTGYQQVPVQKMLPAMLQACLFWLQNGLPLQCVKLVVHSDKKAQIALSMFHEFKEALSKERNHLPPNPPPQATQPLTPAAPPPATRSIGKTEENTKQAEIPRTPVKKGYDYFLSYAHAHANEIQLFVDELKIKNADLCIFYDKQSIPPGGLWIQQISAAIQQADKVLVFLSPDYDRSPVCWDEFQCAKLMEYNRKKSVIQTIYLFGHKETELPLIMGIYSFIDCREGNKEKISHCIQQLLQ